MPGWAFPLAEGEMAYQDRTLIVRGLVVGPEAGAVIGKLSSIKVPQGKSLMAGTHQEQVEADCDLLQS